MLRKVVPAFVLAAALASLAAAPAAAGWKIREADPEFPEEGTTYWFQAGKTRVEGALEGLTVFMDLKSEEGWLLDPAAKRYAGGKIADLVDQLKKLEAESQAAEEETTIEDQSEPEVVIESEPELEPEPEPTGPQTVSIKDLGAGEAMLGYETRHYQVLVDGEILEELWVAPKVDVERDVDLAAFAAMMQKMLGGGPGINQGYEENAEYLKLRKSGYPMKQILYFVGEKSTLAVTAVEAKDFPAADLAVPPGSTQVGYVELLVGGGE